MKKQFFLHIGFKKTATATIQDFLELNSQVLLEKGYLYPWGARFEHKELARASKNKQVHNGLTNIDSASEEIDIWAELHKLIAETACKNVIVSAENFESYNRNYIESLKSRLSPYQTQIVIYIRRQDLRFESNYLQAIKSGAFTGSIRTYFKAYPKQTLDYFQYIERWASVFGTENITVRILEKTQTPDVCMDFLEVLGLQSESNNFQKADSNQNVKPNLDQMRALKLINEAAANTYGYQEEGGFRLDLRHGFTDKYFVPFCRAISFSESTTPFDPVPFSRYGGSEWISTHKYKVLPCKMAKNILARYEASNEKLARKYRPDSNGILFHEKLDAEYTVDSLEASHLSREKLVTVCSFLQSDIVKFGAAKKLGIFLLCLSQDSASADLLFPFYLLYLNAISKLNPFNCPA